MNERQERILECIAYRGKATLEELKADTGFALEGIRGTLESKTFAPYVTKVDSITWRYMESL